MQAPILPPNEVERLDSLRRMNLLYTPDEGALDSVTRTARLIFQTPIVLISLVDHNRQWFKSCLGLPQRDTLRDVSFCGHAILSDEIFVIEDASQDDRFADNPLVTGEPRIRFYAGRPLKNRDGYNVGTLCLIDRVPRVLAPSELQALDDLGKWAELAMMARQPSETQAGFTAGFDEEARYDMLDARLNVWTSGAVRQLLERETMRAFHQQTPLTVVMVEIASFDDIQREYGPPAADTLLAELSRALGSVVRAYDTIGRVGDRQFLIILPNADQAKAQGIMAKLRRACSLLMFMPKDEIVEISVRLGSDTADFRTRTPEPGSMIEAATRNMSETV